MANDTQGRSRLLVCPPEYYQIAYEINPWMRVERAANPYIARLQWDALIAVLEKDCGVALERVAPVKGLPDMVFTANAGVVAGRTVILSRFRHPERRPEEPHFERWFLEHGYEVTRLSESLYFEGAGDMLGTAEIWFGGHFQRSELRTYQVLGSLAGRAIVPLKLVDRRFYHLDTCFCPLSGGDLIWFPDAFDGEGQGAIMEHFPETRRIAVSELEALRFACNAVCVGKHVVIPEGCPETMKRLSAHGYTTHAVELSEFLKAGGAAKCLTLALD